MRSMSKQIQYWAVIPAAGVGKRMKADRPKQYLQLHGKTILQQTLDRLLSVPEVQGAVVSISDGDEYWADLQYRHSKPVHIAAGGKERSDSVLSALIQLNNVIDTSTDRVFALVHDAARPCVRVDDIQRLIMQASDEQGGLLALTVRDTMKRGNQNQCVDHTVERDRLWHALTPQMFRLDLLVNALQSAAAKEQVITDDASAMELSGYQPKLIQAHEDNIKITRVFDLQLADLYLQHQIQATN